MQKTAIIVAMEKELVSALAGFGEAEIVSEFVGKPVYRIKKQSGEVYILNSGVGEIAAAAATQHAIDVYGAELIVNFGFVGSLKPEFKQGDLVAAKEIIHYEFDTSALDGFETGRYEEFPFRICRQTANLQTKPHAFSDLKKLSWLPATSLSAIKKPNRCSFLPSTPTSAKWNRRVSSSQHSETTKKP